VRKAIAALLLLVLVASAAEAAAATTDVGRYASPNPGSVNVLWIQAPNGLVVIDAGRTLSEARRAVAAPGSRDLIGKQERYIRDFRAFVAPAAAASSPGGATVTPEELTSVTAKVEARYPNYPNVASLPTLMEANITAVANEIAAGQNPSGRCGT
jgi:hypothetical protein